MIFQNIILLLYSSFCLGHIIDSPAKDLVDYCSEQPCGYGNTCFNSVTGFKCFCRPGSDNENCFTEEKCMLFNNTGVCREQCRDTELGFIVSHLGGKFMDLKIINDTHSAPISERVPVVNIREQDPCLWQLSGKPNCCVDKGEVKLGCFVTGSLVQLNNGEMIPIEEVKTGMKVLSMVSGSHEMIYSDVIMLMYQAPNRAEEMITIKTTGGKQITLTHDHLLLTREDNSGGWAYKFSENLHIGSRIKSFEGEDIVIEISRDMQRGFYAPVTMTGNIVVDDVVASCYGNHPDHFLAHSIFTPIRLLYQYAPWLYNGDSVTSEGSHPYVAFLNKHLRALTGAGLVSTQYRLDSGTTMM